MLNVVDSRNLQLDVDVSNKALLKRLQVAQKKVADYLNREHRFPPPEPHLHLVDVLGGSGKWLLRTHFSSHFFEDGKGSTLYSIKDGSARPIQKLGDAQLQMTIEVLRHFNVQQNSTAEGGSPFCSFSEKPYTRGAQQLEFYGPMACHMIKVVLKALGGMLSITYGGMKTSQEVEKTFKVTYSR